MDKTVRRNIMTIIGDWRIFRRILKRDLALDRKSGRRRMTLSWSALRAVVMEADAVVTASFFTAIIVATRQVVGVSSPGDVVLILVVGDAGSSLDSWNKVDLVLE